MSPEGEVGRVSAPDGSLRVIAQPLLKGPGVLAAAVLMLLTVMPVQAFERVEAISFAKKEFVFPDDISAAPLHLLFLGIAQDQDNGTWQGEELIRWHRALMAADALPPTVRAWHFAVMENPPFFVKGVIRRAIAKTYAGLMPAEQGAVLYVDDVRQFAAAAGLPLDGQPSIVAWSESDGVLGVWRGEVSDAGVAAIGALLQGESAAQTDPLAAGTSNSDERSDSPITSDHPR